MVGGAVRDLLLHRVHNHPWLAVPDVDLVVEGSALEFVKRVQAFLPPQSVRSLREHVAYGTVELDVVLDGQEVFLDVASARQETYHEPGENPIVRPGSIEDDLARRDFSIAAMTLDLTNGEVLDPYGGQEDLRERRLRLLHDYSLQDDPPHAWCVVPAMPHVCPWNLSSNVSTRCVGLWRPGHGGGTSGILLGRLPQHSELAFAGN